MNSSIIESVPQPILITGIGGFIGSHLAERLLSRGLKVKGMARNPESVSWLADLGAEIVRGNLLDIDSLEQAIIGCRIVVHAAGWTGGRNVPSILAWRTNVDGTRNILEASSKVNLERFIYISSVSVYGLNQERLIDESMETPFVGDLYPDSKIAAEKIVIESGLPYVIVRPACTYGPRGEGWTIGILDQIKQGVFLQGNDDGLITPGYIENVVDGLQLILSRKDALGNIFNICDDNAVTYREFYLAYAKMLGMSTLPTVPEWRIKFGKTIAAVWLRYLLGRPSRNKGVSHFRFNTSQYSNLKARKLLGFYPLVGFEEGMRRTEKWLYESGHLS